MHFVMGETTGLAKVSRVRFRSGLPVLVSYKDKGPLILRTIMVIRIKHSNLETLLCNEAKLTPPATLYCTILFIIYFTYPLRGILLSAS